MKIFIKSLLIFFIITNISKADLIRPEPTLKPLDVLLIQLNSLKNNNTPYTDAGIEQAWEFAHPTNKMMTGPLNRFKQMIYSRSYEILLSHENSEIIILEESKNKSIYKVIILSKDKRKYYYIWQVEKVLFEGELKDCWMTTNVSNPEYIGETI